jgi:O-antigen ligase
VQNPGVLNLNEMIRFGRPLDHPNTAGYLFAMSIPLALAVTASSRGWQRVLAVLSLGLQMLGLILTYSRGAWLGSAASILCFGFAVKKQKQMLSLFALGAIVFLFVTPLRGRLLTLMNSQEDLAIKDRIRIMKDSFEIGLEHPVLGIGYGRGRLKETLRDVYKGTVNEKSPIWHAHNVYVELFAETGILGLGAFLWLLLATLHQTWQKAFYEKEATLRVMRFGLLAALIAFVVAGLGDIPFYHHEPRIYFFTLLALTQLFFHRASVVEAREP